jgi:hypothetical protein
MRAFIRAAGSRFCDVTPGGSKLTFRVLENRWHLPETTSDQLKEKETAQRQPPFPPHQAAILLKPPSLCCNDVADLALPLTQLRNPFICSASNLDNAVPGCAKSHALKLRQSYRRVTLMSLWGRVFEAMIPSA